jgi:mRNA interferase MazF
MPCVRGDVYRLRAPRAARGREQRGRRLCVVVQSDELPLSTWLVAPTSTSARPATFRPAIDVEGKATLVLVEQTTAVDPQRLGDRIGCLSAAAMKDVDNALRTVLDLDA